MLALHELRDQITRYVTGAVSIAAFQRWFDPQAWNVDKSSESQTADLVHSVELLLSEFSHGDWTEEELKLELASLIILARRSVELVALQRSMTSGVQWVSFTVR